MMKFRPLSVASFVLLIAGVYWVFWLRTPPTAFEAPPHTVVLDQTKPSSVEQSHHDTTREDSANTPAPKARKAVDRLDTSDKDDDIVQISEYEEYLDDMSSKALPSKDDIETLKRIANSPVFQKTIFDVLEARNTRKFSFEEEKQRFKYQSYLYEMYLYGTDKTRAYLLQKLENRIFSESFLSYNDIKLRQSLAGDKVDYLRFLKKRYPRAFEDIEKRITDSDSELLKYCLSKA